MNESIVISKNPKLDPSQDYAWLRQRGLQYIQQLGSRLWTDYNIHDPGITVMELLCYALTDLGYRAGFDVADLLAAPPGQTTDFRRQGFYTAREILTINPLTIRDFRKLLIDVDGVKNGWMHVKETACEGIGLYADCGKNTLQYAPSTPHPIIVKGLYDVLVEFEDDERMGDLNSGRVLYNFNFDAGASGISTALIELRMPSWRQLTANPTLYGAFHRPGTALASPTPPAKAVTVLFISGNKTDNMDVQPADRAAALRGVVYVTLLVKYLKDKNNPASVATLLFEDVPMRVWFRSEAARKAMELADLKKAIEDSSKSGLIGRYHALALNAGTIIAETRQRLHANRNLCEDYCTVTAVPVEDISVCADIDVDAAADIEDVLAEAFYQIDRYFSPDVKFHSLQELLDNGVPVETIFEGPALRNGFVDDAQVDSTNLKTALYASDIINFLMDIPGVAAVRNLTLAKYDAGGRQVGSAEPWVMPVTPQHQPRFYAQASKFLSFKNGLPFLPDKAELNDILQVIKGRNSQPKYPASDLDIPIEPGVYRAFQDYTPVQHQLPLTYGVGHEGLPATASTARRAQAKQLKAYLLFFDQLLVNYLAQVASATECFAIDAGVTQTYFTRFIGEGLIAGVETDLYAGLTPAKLREMTESSDEFLDRRNRFLDHLLARFAESFSDYAVMLFRYSDSKAAAKAALIPQKVDFLKDLPRMTHDRAKAFDSTQPADACDAGSENAAGLSLRIKRLLGLKAPDDRVFVVEHLLLRPRRTGLDELLPICIPPGCEVCGEEDPYSFRLTVVISGEGGLENSHIDWRRFAERAVGIEVPAHLAAKICWVSKARMDAFQTAWCAWLAELRKAPQDAAALGARLKELVNVFASLKSVYPPASLHDCIDGNDENRVFLNQSVVTSFPQSEQP